LPGQNRNQIDGYALIVQQNSLPAQAKNPLKKMCGEMLPGMRRVVTRVQVRIPASIEEEKVGKRSHSWWTASCGMNQTLEQQRLTAGWTAHFWFSRCICWL